MIQHIKNPWILSAAICVAVYVLVIAGSIGKPFASDEIYNAGWAHGIAETGTPAYYSGDDVRLLKRLKEPVSHPTFHVNLLAVMILVFGMKYWALRLLGVFLFAGTILFLKFRVHRRLDLPDSQLVLTGFFLVFNPLFVQESIVLAIEAQAFWFFLLMYFYAFYRESVGHARFRFYPYLWTTLGIVSLLWLKETNFPVYITCSIIYLLVIGQFKKLPAFVLASAIAVGIFWSSWLLYCKVTGADVWSWWEFTVQNKMMKGNLGIHHVIERNGWGDAFQRIGSSMRVTITWSSVPYLVLFFVAIGIRVREIIRKNRTIAFAELCMFYALVLFAVTKVLRPTDAFIKYEVPAHLLAAIFMADVYIEMVRKHLTTFLFILCTGLVAGLCASQDIPDRLIQIEKTFPIHVFRSGWIFAIAFLVARVLLKKRTLTSISLGLMVPLVALNTGLYVHQSTNNYVTGQSWGNYGEDLVAPTKWLKKHLKNGEGIAAFKDLQFNMRFVEGKDRSPTFEARTFTRSGKRRKWRSSESEKARILASGKIKYFVLSRYTDSKSGRKYLKKHGYRRVKKVAEHIIYEKESGRDAERKRH
jgi:hypothetical protein